MDQPHSPVNPSSNEGPASKPEAEPKIEQDRELDKINEARWEYDLPPISRRDIRERQRRYMDDKYGYDIDK